MCVQGRVVPGFELVKVQSFMKNVVICPVDECEWVAISGRNIVFASIKDEYKI